MGILKIKHNLVNRKNPPTPPPRVTTKKEKHVLFTVDEDSVENHASFLPARLSHLKGPTKSLAREHDEGSHGVQINVIGALAGEKNATRDRYLFILRLLHTFNQNTKDHDLAPQTHRGKLWSLIFDIRRGEKLCVENTKKYTDLMKLISPCEPLRIDISEDTLSLCMQSLVTTMDEDGLLDPTLYFASLNIAWAGALIMAHQNFRGFKFFQRLSRLLLESVVFMESNGGFYFRQKRIHLRNMAEICKIQEESNYSLRFNCGGYGFSKLMWQSLGTSIKDALNPAASTRATIQKNS